MGKLRFVFAVMAVLSLASCVADTEPEDAELVPVTSSPQALTDPGKTTDIGSNWCCRARTVVAPDHWTCWGMHTVGALAAAKCGVFFAGVPIVEGIRLSKQTCGSVPECM